LFRERACKWGKGQERERDAGLHLTTHDHDLSGNQESDAWPAEPSRCPGIADSKKALLVITLSLKMDPKGYHP